MVDASTMPSQRADPGRPRLPAHYLRRARLARLVESTPHGGFCLVQAPPGYGATSLLTDAARPAVWASLDQLDDQVIDLDSRVEAALSVLGAGARAWIVLDDVDPDQLAGLLPRMETLLPRLTSATRIAASTHSWPGESASRLLRQGTLVEVGGHDLAFTDDEARTLLRPCLPRIDEDALAGVIQLADGWPAALAMVARGGDRHADPAAWLETTGAERLLGPWLESLPADLRSFLQRTAVLDDLNADLCDAVLQANDSASLLARLDGTFLATVRRPHRSGLWWRHHPLLSACLARPRYVAPQTREAHLRAARWFAGQGAVEDQVGHLLAAGQQTEAVQALRPHEERLLAEGRGRVAVEWYRRLPPDVFPDRTAHLLRLGWSCALTCDFVAADAALADLAGVVRQETLRPVVEQTPDLSTLRWEVEVFRAWLAGARGYPGAALEAAVAARQLIGDSFTRSGDQLAPFLEARARLWLGDLPGAAAVVEELRGRSFATPVLQNYGFPVLEAECLLAQGQINMAISRVERVVTWLAHSDVQPIDLVGQSPELVLGIALLEHGQLDDADPLLAAAAQYGERTGHAAYRICATAALARLAFVRGDPRSSFDHLQRARETVRVSAPGSEFLRLLDATETHVRLRVGDVPRADRLIRRLPPGPDRDLLRSRLTVMRSPGAPVAALSRIEAVSPGLAIQREVLLAWAATASSTTTAERHLLLAADLAEACGLATAMVGCPPGVLRMASALAGRRGHDWLARMVELATPPSSPGPDLQHRPLSPGELELISLLPSRASNAVIAEQLSVSVNTVKTRLRRLYAKLGVSGRDAAVERARSLGLL